MKFEEYQEKLAQLEKWIGQSKTGSPRDVAERLNISERTVRRLIDRLKQGKRSIIFCRKLNSYIEEEKTNQA